LNTLTFGDPSFEEGETTSQGAVFKLGRLLGDWKPAGTDIDLFYSTSDNFVAGGGINYQASPQGGQFGRQFGETEEMGIFLSLLDGRLSARANCYETSQNNLRDDDAFDIWNNYARLIAFNIFDNNTTAEIDAAGFQYPSHFVSEYGWEFEDNGDGTRTLNFATGGDGSRSRGDIQDSVSEGFELELVYNLTQNWRLAANVAKTKAVSSNRGNTIASDVAFVRANWLNKPAVAALKTRPGGAEEGVLGTIGSYVDARPVSSFDILVSLNGLSNPEVREWRTNLITTYDFSEDSALKGFSVGGGIRYQSAPIIGFLNETRPNGGRVADVDSPIEGPSETNYDLWIGYQRMIFDDKVNWKLQLNIRNAFTGDELIPIYGQANNNYSKVPQFSEHAATNYMNFRIAPPRLVELRSTFEF
jgi:hypothetical protein